MDTFPLYLEEKAGNLSLFFFKLSLLYIFHHLQFFSPEVAAYLKITLRHYVSGVFLSFERQKSEVAFKKTDLSFWMIMVLNWKSGECHFRFIYYKSARFTQV